MRKLFAAPRKFQAADVKLDVVVVVGGIVVVVVSGSTVVVVVFGSAVVGVVFVVAVRGAVVVVGASQTPLLVGTAFFAISLLKKLANRSMQLGAAKI